MQAKEMQRAKQALVAQAPLCKESIICLFVLDERTMAAHLFAGQRKFPLLHDYWWVPLCVTCKAEGDTNREREREKRRARLTKRAQEVQRMQLMFFFLSWQETPNSKSKHQALVSSKIQLTMADMERDGISKRLETIPMEYRRAVVVVVIKTWERDRECVYSDRGF